MDNILFFISHNFLLSLIWLVLLIVIIFLFFKNFSLKAQIIKNFDAVQLINQKNANIIDTRSLELYNSGHIVNAIHIPLNQLSSEKIKTLNLSPCTPIILILHSSEDNNKYIQKFLDQGINKIYFLKNGMDSWNADKLPVIIKK